MNCFSYLRSSLPSYRNFTSLFRYELNLKIQVTFKKFVILFCFCKSLFVFGPFTKSSSGRNILRDLFVGLFVLKKLEVQVLFTMVYLWTYIYLRILHDVYTHLYFWMKKRNILKEFPIVWHILFYYCITVPLNFVYFSFYRSLLSCFLSPPCSPKYYNFQECKIYFTDWWLRFIWHHSLHTYDTKDLVYG